MGPFLVLPKQERQGQVLYFSGYNASQCFIVNNRTFPIQPHNEQRWCTNSVQDPKKIAFGSSPTILVPPKEVAPLRLRKANSSPL